jgi:hypothetical protein
LSENVELGITDEDISLTVDIEAELNSPATAICSIPLRGDLVGSPGTGNSADGLVRYETTFAIEGLSSGLS